MLWSEADDQSQEDYTVASTRKVQHILTAAQFDLDWIRKLFEMTDLINRKGRDYKTLRDKIVATVFYQPSTRTRFSFEAATLRLGGHVISTEAAAAFSSVIKGESLPDTIKIIGGYADAIVLRHPDNDSAQVAASVSEVPIINAGSGTTEHPTQALLDLYTIRQHLLRVQNLRVVFAGDLLNGRTVHSLVQLLTLFPQTKISFVSPEQLRIGEDVRSLLRSVHIPFEELRHLGNVDPQHVDVLYTTRVQKEHVEDEAILAGAEHAYRVDAPFVRRMSNESIVMHPLPRNSELPEEVDALPQAAYFQQAKNGLWVRMALLEMLLT